MASSTRRFDIRWRTEFHTAPLIPGLPRCSAAAEQVVATTDYHYEGRDRPHAHCSFQYTIEGRGIFWDAGGTHELPPGTGFLCRISDPATGYAYPVGERRPWRFAFVGLRDADDQVEALTRRFGHIYRVPRRDPALRRVFAGARRGGQHRIELTPGESATLVAALLGSLADHAAETAVDDPVQRLVEATRRRIRADESAPPSVAELAAAAGVSPEHLCRVFKAATGVTPVQAIARARTRAASRLLADPELEIAAIADRLGYAQSAHFTRAFKRETGLTPGEFRRRHAFGLV